MTITKIDLIESVCEELDISEPEARVLVDEFFEQISKTLESGESVKLSGFGNFELKEKSARPGRNPKTGDEVVISARRVVTFKAGDKLKSIVQDSAVETVE